MTVIAAKYRAGRVFRQIRRCLVANAGKPVLVAQLLEHCYPRAARQISTAKRIDPATFGVAAIYLMRFAASADKPALFDSDPAGRPALHQLGLSI
jgi:hypothetical protein